MTKGIVAFLALVIVLGALSVALLSYQPAPVTTTISGLPCRYDLGVAQGADGRCHPLASFETAP